MWRTSLNLQGIARRGLSTAALTTSEHGAASIGSKARRSRSPSSAFDIDTFTTALREFHRRHGHAIVPPTFVIPAESETTPWPPHLHGVKLGRLMKTVFSRKPVLATVREELVTYGWRQDEELISHDYREFYWRSTVLTALSTYAALHGNLSVPRTFIVPDGDPQWPVPTWGLWLGRTVNSLRSRGKSATNQEPLRGYQRQALEDIGFVWDVAEYKWSTQFMPALTRYYHLHGHSNVPEKYIVPSEANGDDQEDVDEWRDLPACHGYFLGRAVQHVRRGEAFTAQFDRDFEQLVAIEFLLSSSDSNWNDKILPALECYHDLHGHTNVPPQFVVPIDDPQWPPATRGCRLGCIVGNIRHRGDFLPQLVRDNDRLEAIQFVWNRTEVKWKQMVLPALEAFVEVNRHADVPPNFVVPSHAPWPEAAYNLRLGRIAALNSARNRFANYIQADQKHLESLGFDWSAATDASSDSDEE